MSGLPDNEWAEEGDSAQDSWEAFAESESEKEADAVPPRAAPETKPKRMTVAQKIKENAEARERRRRELAARPSGSEGDSEQEEDEGGLFSTRERDLQLQIESDLRNTASLFAGATIEDQEHSAKLASMQPQSKEEFNEFGELLLARIQKFQGRPAYTEFLESFIKKLAEPLSDLQVRKLSSALTVVANEKQKAAREASKGKKKSAAKKPAVKVTSSKDLADEEPAYDDLDGYDDFM